jgi:hypothetical protein
MTIAFEEQVFKEEEERVIAVEEEEEDEECCEEQQELKKPRIQWIPLESNPDVSPFFLLLLFWFLRIKLLV